MPRKVYRKSSDSEERMMCEKDDSLPRTLWGRSRTVNKGLGYLVVDRGLGGTLK